jgi:hypothetical protein
MVLLRVVAVDLLAPLAGLLDHEEARLGLDYAFDPLSRKDDEVVSTPGSCCSAPSSIRLFTSRNTSSLRAARSAKSIV